MPSFREYSAPSTSHLLGETFKCMWDGGYGYGLRCSDLFRGKDLSAHLREAHNIHGPDKLPVNCLWEDCGMTLKKESLTRHVEETHLHIAHVCDICGKRSFSRRDTLNKHKKTCSGP